MINNHSLAEMNPNIRDDRPEHLQLYERRLQHDKVLEALGPVPPNSDFTAEQVVEEAEIAKQYFEAAEEQIKSDEKFLAQRDPSLPIDDDFIEFVRRMHMHMGGTIIFATHLKDKMLNNRLDGSLDLVVDALTIIHRCDGVRKKVKRILNSKKWQRPQIRLQVTEELAEFERGLNFERDNARNPGT